MVSDTVVTVVLAVAAWQAEAPPRVTDAEAKAAVAAFDAVASRKGKALPAVEEYETKKALKDLAAKDHPLVAKRIAALVEKEKEKRPDLSREAFARLLDQKASPKTVEPAVLAVLQDGKAPPDDVRTALRGVGEFRFADLLDETAALLSHKSDAVALDAVKTLGALGDRRALRPILDFYEVNELKPGQSVSVNVDTGAAGGRDAAAAARAGKARQKQRRGNREEVLAACQEVSSALTGAKIEKAEELRAWMRDHRAELKD